MEKNVVSFLEEETAKLNYYWQLWQREGLCFLPSPLLAKRLEEIRAAAGVTQDLSEDDILDCRQYARFWVRGRIFSDQSVLPGLGLTDLAKYEFAYTGHHERYCFTVDLKTAQAQTYNFWVYGGELQGFHVPLPVESQDGLEIIHFGKDLILTYLQSGQSVVRRMFNVSDGVCIEKEAASSAHLECSLERVVERPELIRLKDLSRMTNFLRSVEQQPNSYHMDLLRINMYAGPRSRQKP